MKTPQLIPYLNFPGNARQVLEFYQRCLGGELMLQTFGEAPVETPAEVADHLMHGMLSSGAINLMASDVMPGMPGELTTGTNFNLMLACFSDEQIEQLFARLSEGGTVVTPLARTFWGARFGILTDQFGIQWMLNFQEEPVLQA